MLPEGAYIQCSERVEGQPRAYPEVRGRRRGHTFPDPEVRIIARAPFFPHLTSAQCRARPDCYRG